MRDKVLARIETGWVGEQPYTLKDFRWSVQEQVIEPTLRFLEEWGAWQVKRLAVEYEAKISSKQSYVLPEKPAPYLFAWGPYGLGKTEVYARGLARYMALNMHFMSVEYVHWPSYVDDQFEDKEIKPNWDAKFLIVDDLDGWRPIQSNPSTYVLQKMMRPIKSRTWPAIIIMNHNPDDLETYFSQDIYGNRNNPVVNDFAKRMVDVFDRKKQVAVKFESLKAKSGPERDSIMREMAAEENDMKALGFEFPIANGWLKEMWY